MIHSRSTCLQADGRDPTRHLRDMFVLPEGVIYLDGNSLGPLPKTTIAAIQTLVEREWAQGLIRSWNDAHWFEMPTRLGDMLGEALGADRGQTLVCDTTSINLYKVLHAAAALRPDRTVIVSEAASFPTDLYVLEGVVATLAPTHSVKLIGRDVDDIDQALDENTAVVLLSHVNYRTGELLDLRAITEKAHAVGALVVWDLSHSAGVVPLALDADGVDFAIGCTYKYLNGGPGAPAYLYAAHRHIASARQPLQGWWGHAEPFAFDLQFRPDPGIKKFLCGTQPIISMKGVQSALEHFRQSHINALRSKSLALTGLFMALVEQRCQEFDLKIVTPSNQGQRGSQVSLEFADGYPVMRAMIEHGVIGDFRAPNIMRFGLAPSYIRFVDVWDAVEILRQCLASKVWQDSRYQSRAAVT
jgi:kynureninase